MNKKKRKIILTVTAFLIIVGISSLIMLFRSNINNVITKKKASNEVIDTIKGYGYTLEKRDTKLFKDKFKDLKKVLSSKDVDFEEYAKDLSMLYIIDLYTINNKDSKYDVGGAEYIVDSAKENYELKVRDTLYKYVEEKTKKRKQELPEVSDILVKDIKETTYDLNDKEYEGYIVDLTFEYVEDLEYDEEASIVLIKDQDKLYIVEQKEIEKEDDK